MKTADNTQLIPMEKLEKAAECLKVMAHPVRLRLVEILMTGDYPVHELARLSQTSPNQTCEHLRMMKSCGFLSSRRDGRTVYYHITTPQLPDLIQCIRKNCMNETPAAE